MPLSSEHLAQYEALAHRAAIAPLIGRTILEVTGPDRLQILQSFTTNDIKRLSPGQGCEAFVTSPQGKTLGHVFIFCEPEKHVIDTSPLQAQPLLEHFNRYIITEDAFFTDKTADFTDLLIVGPKAASLLSSLTGVQVPTEPLGHVAVTFANQPAVLRRVEFASPDAYFLQVATPHVPAAIAALHAAGLIPCDDPVIESARLEAGFPLFGLDITPDNLPQEVRRDAQAISFIKGCYLGQETVARIDAMGHVNRLLVGLQFPADASLPPAGTDLVSLDQSPQSSPTPGSPSHSPLGHVTSAAWSPRLQAPLALAYLRRTHAKPGTELNSSLGKATVITLPLPVHS